MTEMTRAELREALRPDRTEDQMPELDIQTVPTVIDEVHHWGPDKQARVRELLSEPGAARCDVGTTALDDAVVRGAGDA
jgi:hypothetical protein